MRLRNTHPFVLIVGVMLTVSCGGVTAAAHAARSSAALVASGQPTGTPRQRAAADARAILREFVPPPGAVRLAARPKLPSGSATMMLNSATQVDAVGYWRVSGAATALQAWEKAHISRSFSGQDVIVGPPDWNTVYALPAVPGVLPVREMNAQFYDVGGGMTVIMADAMVSWQPPRPASEVIPASAAVVTIAESWLVGPGSPAPVTITSVPVVRRLAALVNGLPAATVSSDVPCPLGAGLTLTFRAAGGPAVAVADGPGACGVVTLTLNGKDEPDLQPPGSYRATILKIAGLHWPLG